MKPPKKGSSGEKRSRKIRNEGYEGVASKPKSDRGVTGKSPQNDALYEQVERTRAILNAAVDAIITIDTRGNIVASNPATERIFGYSRQELLGRNVSMLMPSPYREEHDSYLARYQKTGEAHIIGIGREVTGQRKDGSTFPADLAVSEVDHLGFFTGIVRDISVRKEIQERARREHEFAERLIETTQNIILVIDCDGRIVRYNSVFEKISGTPLEEVEGCDWFDTFLPDRDRDRIRELFLRKAVSKPVRGNINAVMTKSGQERDIEWYSAPLREPEGKVTAIVCSGVDVTDRLRLEQEVYRASEDEKIRIAQDLHDGLGSFLTGIGYMAGALSSKLRQGVPIDASDTDLIVKNINDAINQARALARGLYGIGDQPNALPGALRNLAAWVRSTSGMKCRCAVLDSDISVADTVAANHVYRIAQEAVNNAVRHSGASQLTLRIETVADEGHMLTVLDNGEGFDPAVAADKGIGLHTMEYRARAIGAVLSIRRRARGGTRVECRFPGG